MFNNKPKEESGGGSGGLKKPSIETPLGTLEPASLPFGAKGIRLTKKFWAKGGKVSSASKRADGCAIKGKTRGKMV